MQFDQGLHSPLSESMDTTNSQTSIAQTPMDSLPWLIQTRFLSPYGIPITKKKQILREIFLHYLEIICCVYSLELSHQYDSNEYTQHTIIV